MMLKRLCILLALLVFVGSASAQDTILGFGTTTNTSPLNVRDNASLDSNVVGSLPGGSNVTLVAVHIGNDGAQGIGRGWWGIIYPVNGIPQEYWIAERYVDTDLNPFDATPTATLIPATPTSEIAPFTPTVYPTFTPTPTATVILPSPTRQQELTPTRTPEPVQATTMPGDTEAVGECVTINNVNIYLWQIAPGQ